ncbi:MAG: hypothetical protein U0263_34125 [Polyangiaceae bacterium]
MSLLFVGPSGSTERRWIIYALLRDNVLHHLEGGVPSGRFAVIHGVSVALGGNPVRILASELRRELSSAQALRTRPIAELALSARTVAVISHAWPLPEHSATRLAQDWNAFPQVAAGADTLGDVFGTFMDELIAVAKSDDAGAIVEVRDG